ncbi:MAG TPA: hypothetical protein VGK74_15400 [Symbiobacteriaceae bacterium]
MTVQSMTQRLDLADSLVTTAPCAGKLSIKQILRNMAARINKLLFTPSPKAAARHGLDVWAGIEHVDRYEAYRLQSMRGVDR